MNDRGGWRLGRIFGIPFVIDYSWPLIAALITWTLYLDFDRSIEGAEVTLLVAVAGALLFFGSVLVHELSHSVLAMRRGIGVRRIRLFIFGGVSEIEAEATTAKDEFVIAIGGPVSSLLIGGLFGGLAWIVPDSLTAIDRLFMLLAFVNVALALFNLVPGFPLDGGRVLRSLIWRVSGDRKKATSAAVTVGKVVAALLMAAGVVVYVRRADLGGLWYVAIGWFLYRAAAGTLAQTELIESLRGVTVGHVMRPTDPPVDGDMSVDEFVRLTAGSFRPPLAPVVVEGRVRGLVGLTDVQALDGPGTSPVASAMQPLGPDLVIEVGEPAERLFALLEDGRRLAVVQDGRFVGSVEMADLARFVARRAT